MRLKDPVFKRDFSGGVATNLNLNITPASTVELGLNVVFDHEIGAAVSRLGTAIVGAQLVDNKPILGIHQYVNQSDSSKNKLFATVNDSSNTNSDIYDVVAGTKSLQDDTQGLNTNFLNYQASMLRLNGTDAAKAYNGTSWITTGGVFDLGNIPSGYKFAAVFLSRVYLWGKASAPYTLAFSGILTGGAVSWTSGNGTVEIEPEDNGGAATGIAKVPGYLLLFKERSLHRWNKSSAFPEELVNIGAVNQRSIVQGGGLVAFFSSSNEDDRGFFITNGGRPIPISHSNTRPIKKWVDAIPAANESAIAGWATNKGFAWSVGDLTVDGRAYPNVVLKYNRLLNQWSIHSYPTQFKCFASYVTGGVATTVAGDEDGTVFQIDKSATYTDNGTPIQWEVRDHDQDWGYNQKKKLSDRLVVRGAGLKGAFASVVVDNSYDNLIPLGVLKDTVTDVPIGSEINGTSFALGISGQTTADRAVVHEWELPAVDLENAYE